MPKGIPRIPLALSASSALTLVQPPSLPSWTLAVTSSLVFWLLSCTPHFQSILHTKPDGSHQNLSQILPFPGSGRCQCPHLIQGKNQSSRHGPCPLSPSPLMNPSSPSSWPSHDSFRAVAVKLQAFSFRPLYLLFPSLRTLFPRCPSLLTSLPASGYDSNAPCPGTLSLAAQILLDSKALS